MPLLLIIALPASSEETVDKVLKAEKELEEELKYLKAETYFIGPRKSSRE